VANYFRDNPRLRRASELLHIVSESFDLSFAADSFGAVVAPYRAHA